VNSSGSGIQSWEPSKSVNDFADLDLLVVNANRAEVFGEAIVEPCLRGRIVIVQQHLGKVMRDRAPGFIFQQIEHHEILILTSQKESGNIDWLALRLTSQVQ
jgi:hypothetical protein